MLKDDDAEDDDDEEGDEENAEVIARESRILKSEQRSAEKQPTGRVVGIIKRNWRRYFTLPLFVMFPTHRPLLATYATSTVPPYRTPPRPRTPSNPSSRSPPRVSSHASACARARRRASSGRRSSSPSTAGTPRRGTRRGTLCARSARSGAKRLSRRACCSSSMYLIGLSARRCCRVCRLRATRGLCPRVRMIRLWTRARGGTGRICVAKSSAALIRRVCEHALN